MIVAYFICFCYVYFRVQGRGKSLQNSLNSLQQFDVSIEEYFTWLTKMEARLDAQHQIVTRDGSLDEDTAKAMQSQFKVSLYLIPTSFDCYYYIVTCQAGQLSAVTMFMPLTCLIKLWLWKVIYEMITFCLVNICSKIFTRLWQSLYWAKHLKILEQILTRQRVIIS